MRRVQCTHCETVFKQKLIDPATNTEAGHINMCRCSIAGDCEIGLDCGKGYCECYTPCKNTRPRKNKGGKRK